MNLEQYWKILVYENLINSEKLCVEESAEDVNATKFFPLDKNFCVIKLDTFYYYIIADSNSNIISKKEIPAYILIKSVQ